MNMGIDAVYAALWGFVALIGLAGIFIPATRWSGLAVFALAGYFTYRNVSNLVVARGRE